MPPQGTSTSLHAQAARLSQLPGARQALAPARSVGYGLYLDRLSRGATRPMALHGQLTPRTPNRPRPLIGTRPDGSLSPR